MGSVDAPADDVMPQEENGQVQEASGAVAIATGGWYAAVKATDSCGSPSQAASGSHDTGAPARGGARGAKAGTLDLLQCQVDTCKADLSDLREYHQRYKICEFHLKVRQASVCLEKTPASI
jgi:hypothetical protein